MSNVINALLSKVIHTGWSLVNMKEYHPECNCTSIQQSHRLYFTTDLTCSGLPLWFTGKESGDPGSTPGSGRCPGEGIGYPLQYYWASWVAQLVKNLVAVWETWV